LMDIVRMDTPKRKEYPPNVQEGLYHRFILVAIGDRLADGRDRNGF
jgi:hypothetical protein